MSRYDRGVRRTLQGMAVGDALGMALLRSVDTAELIARRRCPTRPWLYTCATVQTAVVARHIHASGTLHPDHLAYELAEAYVADPDMHYGSNTRALLQRIHHGESWRTLSPGSLRVSARWASAQPRAIPVGYHYARDLPRALDAARLSQGHARQHQRGRGRRSTGGCVSGRRADRHACRLGRPLSDSSQASPASSLPRLARRYPPNKRRSCSATAVEVRTTRFIPIWCALNHHRDYRAAMWCAADGAGRLNVTCALVSGLLCAGPHTPPAEWLERTERLPGRLTLPRRVDTPASPYRRTRA